MKLNRKAAWAAILCAFCLSVTGCDGGSTGGGSNFAESSARDGLSDLSIGDSKNAGADYEYEEGSSTSGEEPEEVEVSETQETQDAIRNLIDGDKLVYTGDVTIETLDFDKSYETLKAAVDKAEGIIESENSYDANDDWYYDSYGRSRTLHLSARIPSKNFNAFMDGINGIGNITRKNVSTDNLTMEYIDTRERMKSLQDEKAKLEELLDQAVTLDDVLNLQERITDLQYQIESAKARLQQIDIDVAYSTVNISLDEVTRYTTTPKTFFGKIGAAFGGSFRFFVNFVQTIIIALIYLIPPVAFLALVVVLVIKVISKLTKLRPPRKPRPPKMRRGPQAPGAPTDPGATAPGAPAAPTPVQDDPYTSDELVKVDHGNGTSI